VTERTGQELVIGLVGAIGTDLKAVSTSLVRSLETVDYESREISLIESLIGSDKRWSHPPDLTLEERYARRMDLGNELRKSQKRKDALALFAMAAIRNQRKADPG
jgi:hypothetical protein